MSGQGMPGSDATPRITTNSDQRPSAQNQVAQLTSAHAQSNTVPRHVGQYTSALEAIRLGGGVISGQTASVVAIWSPEQSRSVLQGRREGRASANQSGPLFVSEMPDEQSFSLSRRDVREYSGPQGPTQSASVSGSRAAHRSERTSSSSIPVFALGPQTEAFTNAQSGSFPALPGYVPLHGQSGQMSPAGPAPVPPRGVPVQSGSPAGSTAERRTATDAANRQPSTSRHAATGQTLVPIQRGVYANYDAPVRRSAPQLTLAS